MALLAQDATILHHNQETEFLNACTQREAIQIQETLFKGAFFKPGKLEHYCDNTLEYFCKQNSLDYQTAIFKNTLTFLETDGSEKIEPNETPVRVACVNVIYNFVFENIEGSLIKKLEWIDNSLKNIETEAL
jgi:hypothetical protein